MTWYPNLVEWINKNDGYINPALILKETAADARGIYANEDIAKGAPLVRLPAKLAVSGNGFPSTYKYQSTDGELERLASPWLRCIITVISTYITKDCKYEQYMKSLPETYETLLHRKSWSDRDIEIYLAGTTIGKMVLQDRQSNTLRTRFDSSVKPYMEANGLTKKTKLEDDELFDFFLMACACVSTRGFHLKENNGDLSTPDNAYSGPFLLPFIDLLNHSSNQKDKCTTLKRRTVTPGQSNNVIAQDGFFMTAERDVKKGEEILHSYGNGLTSGQLLQTFGFVERSLVDRAINGVFPGDIDNDVTPAILSKECIIQACVHVALSKIPQDLEKQIIASSESEMQDFDVWELPSAQSLTDRNSNAVKKQIPNDIIVNFAQPMSDDLVTLCCAQFLPDEAFDEISEIDGNGESNLTMLSSDILEDLFLGSLVLRAIQHAVQMRLLEYTSLNLPAIIVLDGGKSDDASILKAAIDKNRPPGRECMHATYGLTLRIEEKASLNQLKEMCSDQLNSLGRSEDENNQQSLEVNGKDSYNTENSPKRQKL